MDSLDLLRPESSTSSATLEIVWYRCWRILLLWQIPESFCPAPTRNMQVLMICTNGDWRKAGDVLHPSRKPNFGEAASEGLQAFANGDSQGAEKNLSQ